VTRTQQHHLRLNDDSDVAAARKHTRELGLLSGLSPTGVEELVTAVSEIARNILVHAGRGELLLEVASEEGQPALIVTARDEGPGIADLEDALKDGYSTGHGLGFGLPGARRLVDAFQIQSALGSGTTVILKKWLPAPPTG